MTIYEIAALIVAIAFAVLVAYLIPTLVQLRKTVGESAELLAKTNRELPSLLADLREMSQTVHGLAEQLRGGVDSAAGFLHAVGEVGDTVQQLHDAVKGKSSVVLANLASVVAGVRAASAVVVKDRDARHAEEGSNGER